MKSYLTKEAEEANFYGNVMATRKRHFFIARPECKNNNYYEDFVECSLGLTLVGWKFRRENHKDNTVDPSAGKKTFEFKATKLGEHFVHLKIRNPPGNRVDSLDHRWFRVYVRREDQTEIVQLPDRVVKKVTTIIEGEKKKVTRSTETFKRVLINGIPVIVYPWLNHCFDCLCSHMIGLEVNYGAEALIRAGLLERSYKSGMFGTKELKNNLAYLKSVIAKIVPQEEGEFDEVSRSI